MIAGAISVLLKGDGTHFSRSIAKARAEAGSFSKAMSSINSVGSLVRGGIAAVAAGGIGAFVKKTLDGVEASQNFADRIGITQQRLQQLRHAAITNGSSADVMDDALQRMSVTIGDAQDGSTGAAEAFKKIGISVDELSGKDAASQFTAIADAISRIESPAQRAAAVQHIFGRGSSELGRLMIEGAAGIEKASKQADAYGVALNEVDTQKIMHANDAIDDMTQAWAGVANTVVATLAPAVETISRMLERMATLSKDAFGYIADKAKGLADFFGLKPFEMAGAMGMLANGSGSSSSTTPAQAAAAASEAAKAADTAARKSPFVASPRMFTQDDYKFVALQRLSGPAIKAIDPQKEGNRIAQQQLAEAKEMVRLLRKPNVVKEPSGA